MCELLEPRVAQVAGETPLRHKLAGPHVIGKGHSTTSIKLHAEGDKGGMTL
jgi:hypothetical protein